MTKSSERSGAFPLKGTIIPELPHPLKNYTILPFTRRSWPLFFSPLNPTFQLINDCPDDSAGFHASSFRREKLLSEITLAPSKGEQSSITVQIIISVSLLDTRTGTTRHWPRSYRFHSRGTTNFVASSLPVEFQLL